MGKLMSQTMTGKKDRFWGRAMKTLTSLFLIFLSLPALAFAEQEKPRIAVWDFELGKGVLAEAGVPLSDRMRTELFNTQKYIVLGDGQIRQ